ncbi:MAG: hypothetical protein FWD91_01145 [Treponema sp.]|nr:hypothetical protein [Treponema sp.]
MPRLTDEEYAALDEKWTRETPTVNFSRPGMFARQRLLLESLDTVAANYIHIRAEADRTTPAEVIGAMVRREMAARLSSLSATNAAQE